MFRRVIVCLTVVCLGASAMADQVITRGSAERTIVAARDEAIKFPDGSELLLAAGSRATVSSTDRIEISGTAFLTARGAMRVLAGGQEYRVSAGEVAFSPGHLSVFEGEVEVAGKTLRTGDRMSHGGGIGRIPPSTKELDWTRTFRASKRPALITSDAGGMTIKRQEVRISTDGPIVMTQIHFTFHNPTSQRAEGRMKFPLPADASISRLALKIGDRWMEGEFVEKQKARETFEAIVRSMRDPALLEQQEGNIFELRIFPFDPNGDRELILSYTQTISSVEGFRYSMPLPVGQTIEEFSLRATLPGASVETSTANLGAIARMAQEIKVEQKNFTPDRDFTMEVAAKKNTLARGDRTMVARVTPSIPTNEISSAQKWLILVDVSASMIESTDLLQKTVAQLTERLPRNGSARIAFLRENVFEDNGEYVPLGDDRKRLYSHANRVITEGVFLGGSNFSAAAKFIAGSGADRVIFITDGVSVLGPNPEFSAVPRIDLIQPSSSGDPQYLGRLGAKTGGVVLKLNRGEEVDQLRSGVLQLLSEPITLSAHLENEGEITSYGGERRPVFQGDEFVIAAQSGRIPKSVSFRDASGKTLSTVDLEVESVKNEQALARAFALQKIRSLIARPVDEDLSRAVRDEVIRLSREHRVISPYTSLLTLENEYDYQRWGIERDAMAPVLVIEDGSIVTRVPEKIEVIVKPMPGRWETRRRFEGTPAPRAVPSPAAPEMSASTATNGNSSASGDDGFSLNEVNMDISSQLTNDISAFADRDFAGPPSMDKMVVDEDERVALSRENLGALEKTVTDAPLDRDARARLVKALIARGETKKAIAEIRNWIPYDPDNIGLYIQLVDLYESVNEMALARRAAESVVDRLAGAFDARAYLAAKFDEWNDNAEALRQWERARDLRSEIPSVHLSYARSLALGGHYEEAERVLLDVLRRRWDARFGDIDRLAGAELEILYLRWKESGKAPRDIDERRKLNAKPLGSGMWVFLTWNTDGTDVDLHVEDPKGERVSYNNRKSSTGGELLEDLTEGFGPELFAIERPLSGEYVISAHYYGQRVQGPTRGQVTIVVNAGLPTQRIITKPFLLERQGEMVEVVRIRPL